MKRFLYFLFCSIICCYSCKKEDKPTENCRVVGIRTILSSKFYSNAVLGYDENGNLSKVTFSSDTAGMSNFTIKYLKDSVIIKTEKDGAYEYVLDASNRIIKVNPGYYQRYTFTYGSSGFIESAMENSDVKMNFSYKDGNLIKIIKEYPLKDGHYKITYNFNYDIDEKAVDLIVDSNPLYYLLPKRSPLPTASFFGNTSKNRLRAVEIVQESPLYNPGNVFTFDLSYQKDSNGKIVSMNVDEKANSILWFNNVYKFTYECK